MAWQTRSQVFAVIFDSNCQGMWVGIVSWAVGATSIVFLLTGFACALKLRRYRISALIPFVFALYGLILSFCTSAAPGSPKDIPHDFTAALIAGLVTLTTGSISESIRALLGIVIAGIITFFAAGSLSNSSTLL